MAAIHPFGIEQLKVLSACVNKVYTSQLNSDLVYVFNFNFPETFVSSGAF